MKPLLFVTILLLPSLGVAQNTTNTGWLKVGQASGATPGNSSLSVGNGSWAGGSSSSAFGFNAWSYGHYSTTMGIQTRSCYGELAIGRYNDFPVASATTFNDSEHR